MSLFIKKRTRVKKNTFFLIFFLMMPLSASSQSASSYIQSAILKSENNDTIAALQDFNKAIKLDPNNSLAYFERANFKYYFSDDVQSAILDWDTSIALDPSNPLLWKERANAKRYIQKYESAIIDIQRAIEIDSLDPELYNTLGDIYGDIIAFDDSLKYDIVDIQKLGLETFNNSLKLDPLNITSHIEKAIFLEVIGDLEGALLCYEEGIKINDTTDFKKLQECHGSAGRLAYNLDQESKAVKFLTRALAMDTFDIKSYILLAQSYRYLNQNDNATGVFDFLLNKRKTIPPQDYYLIADILDQMEEFELSLLAVNNAIKKDSTKPSYYLLRGRVKYQMNDLKGSLSDYDRILNTDNNTEVYEDAYYFRGLANYTLDRDSLALVDFNKAIEHIDSNFIDRDRIYYARSKTFRFLGDYENAINDLKLAMKIDSLDPWYPHSMAKNYESIGNHKEAKKFYEISENLDPTGQASLYNSTGYFYPYIDLSIDEPLRFPITVDIELFIEDIHNLKLSEEQFFLGFNYGLYSEYDPNYISDKGDSLTMLTNLIQSVEVDYINSDETKIEEMIYDGETTLGHFYKGHIESSFYHNWKLRDYPFDKQRVQIRFISDLDSTIFRFRESEKYQADFVKNLPGLKDGFTIEDIEFHQEFKETWEEIEISPTLTRKKISPVGVFEIIVSRSGSGLVIKLFLGSILSFIISWLVFLIPKSDFSSRIELSVGAIFGAIGNKYFVESTTPEMQVLTKADIINNLVIMMVLFNVILLICQENEKIHVGKLENSNFALRFSAFTMIILTVIIILF